MKTALHLFRRDLRITDNTSLNIASQTNDRVRTGFIFDPLQVGSDNGYKSLKALRFMCESLTELATEIASAGGSLQFWHGRAPVVLNEVLQSHAITSVHVNTDYTPFSRDRDAALEAVCTRHGVPFFSHHDALLTPPGTITTGSGTPFKVFTPFYKAASQQAVTSPNTTPPGNLCSEKLPLSSTALPTDVTAQYQSESPASLKSGRAAGLTLLRATMSNHTYKETRDILAQDSTSHLSVHNKFGTISIREVYHTLQQGTATEPLIRQLYWRDFFTHVAVAFPHVFGNAFNQAYNTIAWRNDEEEFARWCTGTTGFPIVDAGMRELNETGYMHNRARLITASFLTKDLHIDWRWGERYFAQKLIDYDPCVNNGSWQWSASTGCDAQPYFRIFNPWLQQKRFDPDAIYIKRWVPELKNVRAAALHTLDSKPFSIPGYPEPMCHHRERSEAAKRLFK